MPVYFPLRALEITLVMKTFIIFLRIFIHQPKILDVRLFRIQKPRIRRRAARRTLDTSGTLLCRLIQVQHLSHARHTLSPERITMRLSHRGLMLPTNKITRYPHRAHAYETYVMIDIIMIDIIDIIIDIIDIIDMIDMIDIIIDIHFYCKIQKSLKFFFTLV